MTYAQLEKHLDTDLAWRKQEISALVLVSKEKNAEVLRKAVILLLYAHWEGYVKGASKIYIKYISEQKVLLHELSDNFMALAIKSQISQCIDNSETLTLANEFSFLAKYQKMSGMRFKITVDEADQGRAIINTESNLKPRVFKNILSIIGFPYKECIATRERYINSHLIGSRNMIGHGTKFQPVDPDFTLSELDIDRLKDIVFEIIDNFRDELLVFAQDRFFLKANAIAMLKYVELQSVALENSLKAIELRYTL